MDKLRQLYESYLEQGLISKQTSFEQFSSANVEVQDNLYNLGIENKILSESTGLDMFKSAWAVEDLKPVKQEDSASVDPAVESQENTGSKLENGSSDYKRPSERDLIVFNIEETQKQIDNYIAKGGELNESDAKVLQGYKDDLKRFDRGSDFSSRKYEELKDEEKIKLQEMASKELISNKQDEGKLEYNIPESEVEEKAKDILREQMNPSLLSDYSAKTVRGFANFLKGTIDFADMVEFGLMEGALNLFDPSYEGTTEERKALLSIAKQARGIPGTNISKNVGDFVEKLEPYIREYENESMIDDIADGNYLMAGERAVGAALESLPSVVAASTGVGGLTLLAASSAGGKFEEEFNKDPEKGTALLISNALATGTLEAGFELATRGVLKRAGILNSSGNTEAAKKLLEGGANSLIKNLGINTASEAGSEAATKVSTLLLDNITLEGDISLTGNIKAITSEWKSIAEDALVGSVFGTTASVIGSVKNASPAAIDAAENILMPSEIKKVAGNTAKEISELHKALETTSGDSADIIKDEITQKSIKLYNIKKQNSLALENMTSDEVGQYAKNKTKIEDIEKTIKKGNKSESVVKVLENSLEEIKEENKVLYKESVTRNTERKFNADVENVSKSLKSIGQKIDDTLVFETDSEGSSGDKMKDFLVQSGLEESYAEENKNNFGTFVTNKEGKEFLVINKDSAIKKGVVTTGQHEFLHKVLKASVQKDNDLIVKAGKMLLENIKSSTANTSEGLEFKARVQDYLLDENVTENQFYEEVLPLFSEAITRGDININRTVLQKIGDLFRRILQNAGVSIKFNKAKDVENFILDYNKAFSKGKLRGGLKKLATEGLSKDNNEASVVFSKVSDIEAQIEELEDQYDNDQIEYYAYENKLDILEAELEKAKKAPVEEPKKQVKAKAKSVEDTVKESTEKVFKETEISDRNKGIAKINEDIANEMLELGVNSISEIKDEATKKAIVDKLGKNNLGAVTNLAKKATAAGKDLAIDDNLKVGYDEFFSGFSEELSALIRTYKVKVDGKRVPFGAYMNKNLQLRYGQILDKALKGRIKGSQSLDVQSGEKGFAGSIAAESAGDFDAYSNAEQGLPAGDLIDVTTFTKVKDKESDLKESIDLSGVDVADLTYRQVQDRYAGDTGATIIGMYDKNAKPDENEDRNKFQKLSERIEGTRTLNYGKDKDGFTGEAEVRAMQDLFKNYNDVVKFIKTIPEFNVAPFETTIDKQGKSVDLTTDARGYSTGVSNKLLKKFYEPYIDPKSKSSDKDTKSRSITSPSGRGKGKTSQVAKVFRLKPEYRGRISRQTVKDLQKTIGITEAGEAFIPMKGLNRTEFGTALQGLTKMYATNVANTIIRKNIVEKGITSDRKPTEKVLADIGGGKSRLMFSKAIDNFDPGFNINFSKSFNKSINDEFGFKSKYYTLDPTSKDWPKQKERFLKDYETFVKNTAIGSFKPRFFISSKNTLNPSTKKTDKNYKKAYKERSAVRNEMRNINQKYSLANIGFVTPPKLYGRTVKSIEENINNNKVEEANNKYTALFDKTWISIADLIRKDRSMIPFIGHFLETSGETDHWTRLGAKFTAYDTKPESVDFTYIDKEGNKIRTKVNYEYEHAVPAHLIVKELFRAAADSKVNFYQELTRVKENYNMIALSAKDASKLTRAGLAYKMPKNWNTLWDRYFNKEVASFDGGIDIDNIMLIESFDGKPVKTPLKEVLNINKDGSRVSFSKMSDTFNDIIENKTGILASDTISEVKAKMIANNKRNINFFIPPSAEDFVGLLYATLGKGKVGDKQMKFYERTLLKPYARAMAAVTRDRMDLGRAFKKIKKEFNTTPKDLKKKVPGSLFDKEQAVRVYIWDSIGKEVPGLDVEDVNELANYVADNKELRAFAEQVMRLNPGSKYLSPGESWETGTITTDLLETLNTSRRAKHLGRWQQNVDEIFSKENLNKLEAAYGTKYRKAMENILTRMKTGRNRTYGSDSQTAKWIDWTNGSVGAIMFLNARSAVLQTISATNFINFGDNNIFKAAKAFANQKQYWSDFAMLMNSDYLLERRDSLKINVNEADIADAARQKGARGAINYLLKLGFTPTKFADSFAIASGGAAFYRNKVDALLKKGMDQEAAEKAAMREFIETAEESQQSSRPDKISQEQAGPLGRVILAFANTPAQYARIIKKSALDLKNGRGDARTNISRIVYYGFLQNLIFNTLQQALLGFIFGDEEDEDLLDDKKLNRVNGMLDGIIRGTGVAGAVFSVAKNVGIKIYKEANKKNPKYESVVDEALKISPPISSKYGKLKSAGRTFSWDMKEIKEKGVDITSPAIGAGAQITSALTNIPLDRVVKKVENLKAASDSNLETYKRLALVLGWGKWELGIKDEESKDKSKKSKSKSRKNKGRKVTIR